ncbi:uncharacterized protein LOC120181927 [Hibiscus syriacus]|uniref:uncharacterized protein LOC120181927 n=1 Tax=Hibiscus syriacus TaxID=106335 RepID=UPI00192278DD|nr:uncharacterized protein LOC120181927 [Hibiscus syriacus]
MNVLSSLLDASAKKGIFRYHPKCKRVSLTHLCFADDLLVFCHGSLDSVLGVLSTLEAFYDLSGLRLNAQKTELFACGLTDPVLQLIQSGTGFKVGMLLVKYLGVPLVTRKLSGKDCSALLTKIKEKLGKWSDKKLSYGGRLQLIKSLEMPRTVDLWNVEYKAHFSWIIARLLKMRNEAASLFCSNSNWDQIKASWIWDRIRIRGEKVCWHCLVWFPGLVPKFSLITWMAILDRLPTNDRLARFGIATDGVCGLCSSGLETRNHIFSECTFANETWCAILLLCGLNQTSLGWNDLLQWLLLNLKGKSLMVHMLMLAWIGFIYCIWEERNRRQFRGVYCSVETIVSCVKESV